MEKRHLFERENQQRALREFDGLAKIKQLVDWEVFRPRLEQVFGSGGKQRRRGRPPWDAVVMFRALLLGAMHGLSDHQLQFMLLDRTSFKEFAGLKSIDQVPDQKTLWKYRDQLSKSGCMDELFGMFKDQLWARGYELTSGQIVDSSIVSVPVQRNSREENTKIKGGEVPEDWQAKPNKLRQKDVAARWTRKGVKNYYGYKNHISADRQTKFIAHWCVTAASTHDSKMLMEVLSDDEQGDRQVWADSAYRSEVAIQELTALGYKPRINHKGTRSKSLNARQKQVNRAYSKVRARVEHVFGAMSNEMHERHMRCIGLARATTWIGLRNLCYNMRRLSYLEPPVAAA